MDYISFFGSFLSFLLLYKYVALFVLVFFSAVGFPIPSSTLLMAAGAFASQSYFNLSMSLAVACAANVLGDLLDYFLVRKYGRALLRKNYHKRFSFIVKLEGFVKFLERYFQKYQRSTIFITRFFGSASTIVNILSGLLPVKLKTFIVYDALGNIISIALMIMLGFFISESWQDVAGIIGTTSTIISAIIILAIAIIIIRRFNKSRENLL